MIMMKITMIIIIIIMIKIITMTKMFSSS